MVIPTHVLEAVRKYPTRLVEIGGATIAQTSRRHGILADRVLVKAQTPCTVTKPNPTCCLLYAAEGAEGANSVHILWRIAAVSVRPAVYPVKA